MTFTYGAFLLKYPYILLLMEIKKEKSYYSEFLLACSTEERKSYGFETT